MRGEFSPIWQSLWPILWRPLLKNSPHEDLPCEYSRALLLFQDSRVDLSDPHFVDAVSEPEKGWSFFRDTIRKIKLSETELVALIRSLHGYLCDFDDVEANRFKSAVSELIERFSLRYEVREPLVLVPTLPGIYARMMRSLKSALPAGSPERELYDDFSESIADYLERPTTGRLKTTFVKNFNLLEALAVDRQEVDAGTLGACARQMGSFPHQTFGAALSQLYGFRSDQPGINHGRLATPTRQLNKKDFVAIHTILLGFMPYILDGLPLDDL